MSKTDMLTLLDRKKEYQYFHELEEELIQKLRESVAAEDQRRALGEVTGVIDSTTLHLLQELGYDRETVQVIHLVPLIQVAWSDGSVSTAERAQIVAAARARGILEGSAADAKLQQYLRARPSEEVFAKSLAVIRALLAVLPSEERHAGMQTLVELSTCVAEASGGLFGLGSRLSESERAALEWIAREIQNGHTVATRAMLGHD